MQKKIVMALVGLLLAIALGLLWFSRDKEPAADASLMPKPGQNTAEMVSSALSNSVNAASRFTTGLEGMPKSLQDTEVDGALEVDANGNLKITKGAPDLRLFPLGHWRGSPDDDHCPHPRPYPP